MSLFEEMDRRVRSKILNFENRIKNQEQEIVNRIGPVTREVASSASVQLYNRPQQVYSRSYQGTYIPFATSGCITVSNPWFFGENTMGYHNSKL